MLQETKPIKYFQNVHIIEQTFIIYNLWDMNHMIWVLNFLYRFSLNFFAFYYEIFYMIKLKYKAQFYP